MYNKVRAVCACYVHTAWATVLLVQFSGQYQSLYSRNSKIAVPLCFLYEAEHNQRLRFFRMSISVKKKNLKKHFDIMFLVGRRDEMYF